MRWESKIDADYAEKNGGSCWKERWRSITTDHNDNGLLMLGSVGGYFENV